MGSFENLWMGLRYFVLYPVFSLFPHPYPYLLSNLLSRWEYRYHSARREKIRQGMLNYLPPGGPSGTSVDEWVRRYFEVVFCDEMDQYLYLAGRSKGCIRNLRIEGMDHLEEALAAKAVILLTSHFGGGFWLLPYLKSRGKEVHCLSMDLKRENYGANWATYYYLWMRHRIVVHATGAPVLYKWKGREEIIRRLDEGKWVQMLYDVPPFMVRDKLEMPFLRRKVKFAKGAFTIAREMGIPVLFFFSFLDGGRQRRIVFQKPMEVVDDEQCVRQGAEWIEARIMERPDHWHFWSIADQFFSPSE